MSQELQVLQCYLCQTFQTQIVKTSNKWICKICNEKQSLKKVFGQGSGKDCRLHCQKLNSLRGKVEEDYKALTFTELEIEDNYSQSTEEGVPQTMTSGSSKWTKFLSQLSDSDSADEYIGLDKRPSQLLPPQRSPESVDVPLAKKIKNDFGQSEYMKHMLFNSDDDQCFDIDVPEDSMKIPSLQNCESLKKIDLDVKHESKSNFSENKSSKLCDKPVNFDLFHDDLMEDNGIKGVSDTNIFQGASVHESKSKSEKKSNLCLKTIKVSNPDQDGKHKSRKNVSENRSSKLCDNSVNFDLFGDDLMEDNEIEDVCDSNIFQGTSVLKSNSRSGNKSNLCVKTVKVSNPVNMEIMSAETNDHAVFKMVPSSNLVVDQLRNRISLLEDINLYTLDQLTNMCKF